MVVLETLVVVTTLAVLALGGLLVRAACSAYRRTGSRSLRALAVAFGLITLGGVLGWGVGRLPDVGLEAGVLVTSVLTALGFAVLAYALYVADERILVG